MSLEGIWDVREIAIGGELVPPLKGTSLTLEFLEDRVAGSAGINRFTGFVNTDRLFGTLATTKIAGPADHMSQERFYLAHLTAADCYEVDADGLRLIADEMIVVTLKRPGSNESAKTL